MSSNTKVKVPKPIVLPSMRKEHNGYDPKLSLINKGNTHISVGATRRITTTVVVIILAEKVRIKTTKISYRN